MNSESAGLTSHNAQHQKGEGHTEYCNEQAK